MNLPEIAKPVRDLPAATIAPEVMEELVRRRQELAAGTAKIITLEEFENGMGEAIDEVRRSHH